MIILVWKLTYDISSIGDHKIKSEWEDEKYHPPNWKLNPGFSPFRGELPHPLCLCAISWTLFAYYLIKWYSILLTNNVVIRYWKHSTFRTYAIFSFLLSALMKSNWSTSEQLTRCWFSHRNGNGPHEMCGPLW